MKIKKFNEDFNTNQSNIKLIGTTETEIDNIIIGNEIRELEDGSSVCNGKNDKYKFILIVKNGEIKVIILQYENINTQVLGNILIVAGYEDVIVYDNNNGTYKQVYTR